MVCLFYSTWATIATYAVLSTVNPSASLAHIVIVCCAAMCITLASCVWVYMCHDSGRMRAFPLMLSSIAQLASAAFALDLQFVYNDYAAPPVQYFIMHFLPPAVTGRLLSQSR